MSIQLPVTVPETTCILLRYMTRLDVIEVSDAPPDTKELTNLQPSYDVLLRLKL